jgi:hypothetical protein
MRCVIESKSADKPMLRSGAKAMAFFAERDIGPPQLKWRWRLFKLYACATGTRPCLLLQWSERDGYTIKREALELVLPSMTVPQALEALTE